MDYWISLVVNLTPMDPKPQDGMHTCEGFIFLFEAGRVTSSLDLWVRKTLNPALRWEETPVIWDTPAAGGSVCSLPVALTLLAHPCLHWH